MKAGRGGRPVWGKPGDDEAGSVPSEQADGAVHLGQESATCRFVLNLSVTLTAS